MHWIFNLHDGTVFTIPMMTICVTLMMLQVQCYSTVIYLSE